MKIKGDFIKEGKPLSSGRLYKIYTSRTVPFWEAETKDMVNIHFHLDGSQYGIYGNEYKPPFVEDQGGKKADIMALVIDEDNRKFESWVLDVKKTIGGEDVIYHLVEQLIESLKHKNAIAIYLDGYEERQHIGYIAREIQRGRIQDTIEKKRQYIAQENQNIRHVPLLIGAKAKLNLLKEEAKLEALMDFQNDCIKVGRQCVPIECHQSTENEDSYVYDLDVSCFIHT